MRVNFDFGDVMEGLDQLGDDAYSVARTMGEAVGAAMRDEAKQQAPRKSGLLASAIYLAFSDDSTETRIVYSVSWNRKKAPHGHLVEFGHWRTNVVVQSANGQWVTTKERLAQPKWVNAKPFLRPAYMTVVSVSMRIAGDAGRKRFAQLQAEK